MKAKFLLLMISSLLLYGVETVVAQDAVIISGAIKDKDNGEALNGVNVRIKGSNVGIATNREGQFELKTRQKLPFKLIVSLVGFQAQEFEVNDIKQSIALNLSSI